MKSKFLKASLKLGLMLILLATGCQSVKTADIPEDFKLETLANVSSTESVLEKYKSVRMESTYYQPSSDNGEWTSFQETVIYIKGDNGIALYFASDDGYENAIFKDNAYFKDSDGTYGVFGCIDGGHYEQLYVPKVINSGLVYMKLEGEKLVSHTVENGVRTLVVQADVKGSYAEYLGITQGVIETVYELDLESGLILRASECVVDGGKKQMIAEGYVLYGEDDSFPEPEYVMLCRDMSETRTVHFIQDADTPDEKTYTFTLPKKAELFIETESEFELFTDPAYTVPHEGLPAGEHPDETTLYVRKF